MCERKCLKTLLLVCFTLVLILGLNMPTLAQLPVVSVKIPTEWQMQPQKVIFSADGSKFALSLEQIVSENNRTQAILIYDFVSKEWSKAAYLTQGAAWALEPLALNFDGSKLAFRLQDDLIIYDTKVKEISHHLKNVGSKTQVAFSYDGFFLAFLMNAEWEVPTNLAVMNLLTKDKENTLTVPVAYAGDSKAAGPLFWGGQGEIYFIEEFTWGSINSRGILKQYIPGHESLVEIYNTKSSTMRVTNYFLSTDGQYLALILRDLQDDLKTSRYGLMIKTPERFVYGQQLPNWIDVVEHAQSDKLSTAGWIGKKQFYWVNRTAEGSDLYIYHLEQQQGFEIHYPEQVYVAPNGVIIKLER